MCDDENPRIDNQKLHCLLYVYSSSYIFPKGHIMYYSSQCLWFSSEYDISNPIGAKCFNVRMQKSSFEFGLYIYLAFQAIRLLVLLWRWNGKIMFSYDIVFCMLLCKFFLVFQISPVTCVVCHSTQQSGMKGSYSIGIFVKLKTYCSRQDVIYENSCYILYSHLIVLLCCIISR